jgi:hypothetical protein
MHSRSGGVIEDHFDDRPIDRVWAGRDAMPCSVESRNLREMPDDDANDERL